MAHDVHSMSLKGVIREPQPKADRLMSYYFTSNYSQSNLFRPHIVSLPRQIQHYGSDILRLCSAVERELTGLLAHYFDQVSCEVRSDLPNPADPARYNLTVSVLLMQDGTTYSLGRLIEVEGNAIKRIMKHNNTGVTTQ